MEISSREEWRAWLEENCSVKSEIWLVHYKKSSGKTPFTYDDAIEEALCFGWIDGIVKSMDNEKYLIRYSPRRKNSIWSEKNKKRVAQMVEQGRMTEVGLSKVNEAKKNGEWARALKRDDPERIPAELKKALQANEIAQQNFERLAPSYQKQFIWWITSAKREDTRLKRISQTVRLAEQNKKPGTRPD